MNNKIYPHIRIDKTIADNQWMDKVEQVYNSGYFFPPGPFANDADAAANGVPLNAIYLQTGGAVLWRQT